MNSPLYALVAYVSNSVGEFAQNLRKELNPEHPDLPAHLTVLPPRYLQGTEAEALEQIEDICRKVDPFEVGLGDIESFMPITPTIFIRVAQKAYRMRELHDHMNAGPLFHEEQWPYMPHLTIIKLAEMSAAASALERARRQWSEFTGTRSIFVDQLTFVRGGRDLYEWADLAPIPLGKSLTPQPVR
jgi:2'-5' RNA ligase